MSANDYMVMEEALQAALAMLAARREADDVETWLRKLGIHFLGTDKGTETLRSVGESGVLGIDYSTLPS